MTRQRIGGEQSKCGRGASITAGAYAVTVAQERASRRPKVPVRESAARVARTLREHGYIAWFAGGCVRDELLGLEPKDYDVATDARPEAIKSIFKQTHGVGAAFGVVLVRMNGHSIEVTTFRAEGAYSDGRHPDQVIYADARQDADRRDFTMNGLFRDPETGEVIDYVGGRADLERGIIRAIGDPHARLREDRLRMLRAVRFAARFDFALEPETERAIRAGAGDLEGVSGERIGQEVEWMLSHPRRAKAAALMQSLRLDGAVLKEQARQTELMRLAGLPDGAEYSLALAAWWLDRWWDQPAENRPEPGRWRAALILPNRTTEQFIGTLECRSRLLESWEGQTVAQRKRLAASEPFEAGLLLVEIEDPALAASIRADVTRLSRTGLAPEPLIGGNDLLEMGLQAGPAFKRILDAVYDAQLEGKVRQRSEALTFAAQVARETGEQIGNERH